LYSTIFVERFDVNILGVNILGANILGANILGANILGANILGANILGANILGVILFDLTLKSSPVKFAYPFSVQQMGRRDILWATAPWIFEPIFVRAGDYAASAHKLQDQLPG
jgi:hypothetical protein